MRTLRRMGIAVLAAAGLTAGLVSTAAAQEAEEPGEIVYEENDGTDASWFDIWIMNGGGEGEVNLTNTHQTQELQPETSPDGTKIVYISNPVNEENPDGNFEIFTMNIDGSGVFQVTKTDASGSFVQSYDPTWSPDGSKIAFSGYRASLSGSQIFTINADGTGEVNLTTSADYANKWEPDWSPDGSNILFTWGWDEYSQDLHVINPDGTGDTNLTPDTLHDAERNASWSPDGTRIAFRWDRDCCGIYPNVNAEIYVMEYPSLLVTRVTEHDAIDEDPAWSPDGSEIVFTSLRGGTYDLFTVAAPPVATAAAPKAMATASSAAEGPVTPLKTGAGDQRAPFWGGSGTAPVSHTLSVTRAGDGRGAVSSSPAGITCGRDCSETYAAGTQVTLTAKTATGSSFAGWSGACTGTSATCAVTMDAARSVTATFTTGSTTGHTLSVTRAGDGRGSVTSNPAGIACGSDCTETYAAGTQVTLTAKTATGSSFAGWSGACTGTSTTCVVSMDAARSVTATFTKGSTPAVHELTVTRAGMGASRGTVTSSPAGIACGSDCAETYTAGTQVTLTATVTTGASFAGWSGACTGTSTTCVVTMDAARSVTATFNRG